MKLLVAILFFPVAWLAWRALLLAWCYSLTVVRPRLPKLTELQIWGLAYLASRCLILEALVWFSYWIADGWRSLPRPAVNALFWIPVPMFAVGVAIVLRGKR